MNDCNGPDGAERQAPSYEDCVSFVARALAGGAVGADGSTWRATVVTDSGELVWDRQEPCGGWLIVSVGPNLDRLAQGL